MKQLLIIPFIFSIVPLLASNQAPASSQNAAADQKSAHAAAQATQRPAEADQKANAAPPQVDQKALAELQEQDKKLNSMVVQDLLNAHANRDFTHINENPCARRVRLAQQAQFLGAAAFWTMQEPYFAEHMRVFDLLLTDIYQKTNILKQLSYGGSAALALEKGCYLAAQFFLDQRAYIDAEMRLLPERRLQTYSTLTLSDVVNIHRVAMYELDLAEGHKYQ
jgi:hypothetical protein